MSASRPTTEGAEPRGRTLIALDTKICVSLLNAQHPKEVTATDKGISRIGNLCDVPSLTKLNISFNKDLDSLDGVEQLSPVKDLWCFACSLRDLTGLQELTKLEVLYLQHNRLERMGDFFKPLTKLRDLRIDNNRLTKVEGLQSCMFLRKLDLSHNNLTTIDGLSGLQSLQELKLNHNQIRTLASLRGLPVLTELDVTNNHLKSLDGIQHFLKLEVVRAGYNHMVHLTLQPYTSAASASAKAAAAAAVTASSQSAPSSRSGKHAPAKKDAAATKAQAASVAVAVAALPAVDRPVVAELHLRGNRIRSIKGLEMYSHCLSVLDLGDNQLTDVLNLLTVCRDMTELSEVYLHTNPFLEDEVQRNTAVSVLAAHCRKLSIPIESVFIAPPPERALEDVLGETDIADTASMGEFHTWNDDGSTVLTAPAEPSTISQPPPAEEKKEEAAAEEEEEEEDAEINALFVGPKLTLKSMLTEAQIQQKEAQFRTLLTHTKDKLSSTVFQFLYPDSAPLGTGSGEPSAAPTRPMSQLETMQQQQARLREEAGQQLSAKLITALDRALIAEKAAAAVAAAEHSSPRRKAAQMTVNPSQAALSNNHPESVPSVSASLDKGSFTSKLHAQILRSASFSDQAQAQAQIQTQAQTQSTQKQGKSGSSVARDNKKPPLAVPAVSDTKDSDDVSRLTSHVTTHGSRLFSNTQSVEQRHRQVHSTVRQLLGEQDVAFAAVKIQRHGDAQPKTRLLDEVAKLPDRPDSPPPPKHTQKADAAGDADTEDSGSLLTLSPEEKRRFLRALESGHKNPDLNDGTEEEDMSEQRTDIRSWTSGVIHEDYREDMEHDEDVIINNNNNDDDDDDDDDADDDNMDDGREMQQEAQKLRAFLTSQVKLFVPRSIGFDTRANIDDKHADYDANADVGSKDTKDVDVRVLSGGKSKKNKGNVDVDTARDEYGRKMFDDDDDDDTDDRNSRAQTPQSLGGGGGGAPPSLRESWESGLGSLGSLGSGSGSTRIVRALSAPSVRPGSSSAGAVLRGGGVPGTPSHHHHAHSAEHLLITPSQQALGAGSADVHTRAIADLLRGFHLPQSLQAAMTSSSQDETQDGVDEDGSRPASAASSVPSSARSYSTAALDRIEAQILGLSAKQARDLLTPR